MSLVSQAHEAGRIDRERGRLRASPFYRQQVIVNGKRVDVTAMLDAAWYDGWDGLPIPEQPNAVPIEKTAALS